MLVNCQEPLTVVFAFNAKRLTSGGQWAADSDDFQKRVNGFCSAFGFDRTDFDEWVIHVEDDGIFDRVLHFKFEIECTQVVYRRLFLYEQAFLSFQLLAQKDDDWTLYDVTKQYLQDSL